MSSLRENHHRLCRCFFAMAILLLAFPGTDISQMVSRFLCHPMDLSRSVSYSWEKNAGLLFAAAGVMVVFIRWYVK
jgi:hypothetical protein